MKKINGLLVMALSIGMILAADGATKSRHPRWSKGRVVKVCREDYPDETSSKTVKEVLRWAEAEMAGPGSANFERSRCFHYYKQLKHIKVSAE